MTSRSWLFIAAFVALTGLPRAGIPGEPVSRVYVTAYPCATRPDGSPVVNPAPPDVSLYDQRDYGDSGNPTPIRPTVVVTSSSLQEVHFQFDIAPGSYDAFFHFRTTSELCGRNGPLVTITGKNRHLLISAFNGLTEWHAPAAVAGEIAIPGISVSALVYNHPMHCGDKARSYDPPQKVHAIIDDGAYYANFDAFGKQDHTIALQLSGGLFTRGFILLTATPNTEARKAPMIQKNITADVVRAAVSHPDQLNCVSGF